MDSDFFGAVLFSYAQMAAVHNAKFPPLGSTFLCTRTGLPLYRRLNPLTRKPCLKAPYGLRGIALAARRLRRIARARGCVFFVCCVFFVWRCSLWLCVRLVRRRPSRFGLSFAGLGCSVRLCVLLPRVRGLLVCCGGSVALVVGGVLLPRRRVLLLGRRWFLVSGCVGLPFAGVSSSFGRRRRRSGRLFRRLVFGGVLRRRFLRRRFLRPCVGFGFLRGVRLRRWFLVGDFAFLLFCRLVFRGGFFLC